MTKIYPYKFIQKIVYAGLERAKSPINRKGIIFINRMSIVNTLLMLAFSITVPFLNLSQVLFFTVPFTFLFALPPWFNSLGYFSFCRYYFSILPLFFVTGVCIHNSGALGDKYLILTTAAIPLILFRDKQKIYLLFALNILIFLLVIWYQNFFQPMIKLPADVINVYFILAQ